MNLDVRMPRAGSATMAILVAVGMTFVADPELAQTEPQAKPRPLRVMTYNIKHGQTNAVCTQPPRIPGQPPFPDCNLDLTATIEVMREHGADIIGVQEVDRFWARSSYLDEPAELAAGVGMNHHCYAANLDHVPDSHSNVPHQYGTVILSRFPILECGNTLLRRTGTNEQRGLTRALINVRGVPLQLYNTHLHTTAADRLLQTADIAGVIDAAPEGPKILMGDFNARPTAVEMQPIYSRFLDSWLEAPAPTAENPSGFTSPARLSSNPTSRIDYVFVSPDVDVSLACVPIDAKTRLASDHYPVVSNVALPGSAVGIGRKEPTLPEPARERRLVGSGLLYVVCAPYRRPDPIGAIAPSAPSAPGPAVNAQPGEGS
jgi:endonuclease/exonuclease/phosphatase family metal-dependent hydrolase